MMRILKRWMVMLGLMVFFACGETPGTGIEFTNVVQSTNQSVFGSTNYHHGTEPLIKIATFTTEKEVLQTLVYEELQPALQTVIPSDSVLIGVFAGAKQLPDTTITIDTITVTDRDIYVQVDIDQGQERLRVPEAIFSPFQVVSIPTSSFPLARPVTVHLIDDATNQEIATTVYPAP